MKCTLSPGNSSCIRFNQVATILGDNAQLLRFFFNDEGTSLNLKDAKTTRRLARLQFDESQNTLICLALDAWLGTARTKAMEILWNLDGCQIENLLIFFTNSNASKACNCQNCMQRFGIDADAETTLSDRHSKTN